MRRPRGNTRLLAAIALAFSVGCSDREDPCGCGIYSGSPHDFTSYAGGPSTTDDGSVTIATAEGRRVFENSSTVRGWSWEGGLVSLYGIVPVGWTDGGVEAGGPIAVGDGGTGSEEAGAGEAGATGASSDGAASGLGALGELGEPYGYRKRAPVAALDLGRTPLDRSGRLVEAILVYCEHPYEELVRTDVGWRVDTDAATDAGGGVEGDMDLDAGLDAGPDADASPPRAASSPWTCESATRRPALVEPLAGDFEISTTTSGDTTYRSTRITATTVTGSEVSILRSTRSEAYRSTSGTSCY